MHIIELSILIQDIPDTIKFYSGILGLPVHSEKNKELTVKAGSTILKFIESPSQNSVYHFAFNIHYYKFREALDWMEPRVDILTTPEQDKIVNFNDWKAKSFYFRDNNYNILECIAREDIIQQTDHRHDGSFILSVSEIGVAVDDVPYESERIKKRCDLDYFTKQESRKDFAAMGDENGLLLLAGHKRKWFPTNTPAEKLWTRLRFSTNGKMHDAVFHEEQKLHFHK